MGKKSKVVYPTNSDYLDEVIKNVDTLPKEEQQLRVWLKRLGGGRLLTVVKEFVGADDELLSLGKVLKMKCSSGGTVKNGDILIQGDHRDKIVNLLNEKGYKAKASGG